jgi:hypothetical protein
MLACQCSADPSAIMKGCNPVFKSSKDSATKEKFNKSYTRCRFTTGVLTEKASGPWA